MTPAPAALPPFDADQALRLARETFHIEVEALNGLAARVDGVFAQAVQMVLQARGRVVVMGMGKSGHVGRKIAATLASTGTPAFFVHPAEASHGDLGMVTGDDLVLAISNSGESGELTAILPVLRRLGAPMIAMTGGLQSTLARYADLVLDCRPPVMAIMGAPRRRSTGRMAVSSPLSPLLELASTRSSLVTMPRSPWLASAGWTKNAGVPVEASVAAILRPTWPLLPMPMTTTRPRACSTICTAWANTLSTRFDRAVNAAASMSKVSRARRRA